MIKIVAENYIKEEYQKEVLKLTKELIILSREEPVMCCIHLIMIKMRRKRKYLLSSLSRY